MPIKSDALTNLRKRLREVLEEDREGWSATRSLVAPSVMGQTIQRLQAALEGSPLDADVRKALLHALGPAKEGPGSASNDELRDLTGLNPTKAIRNLCLLLELSKPSAPVSAMAPEAVEKAVQGRGNPFDFLVEADIASLVDLGAGDLTFEEKVVEQYAGVLQKAGRDLVIHAIDRLDPQESFGELVQANRERLRRLQHHPTLQFRFFGNSDMLDLAGWKTGCSRYAIAVCHSPASPTFAYEPSRLGQPAIQAHLRAIKGEFRKVRVKGREVLEVLHGGERLTFPPWKFDVHGPLALLDLLSRKGRLCVLGAVDMEVFLEILSQLLPDEGARPQGVFFTADNAGKFFGPVYEQLLKMPVGGQMALPAVRQDIPRVLGEEGKRGETHGFRRIEIRRGAVFPGVPAGKTAHVFEQMTQEAAPWFLTLVPAA